MSSEMQLQYNANQSLLGFVPALILQKILQNPAKEIAFPEKQTTTTVVMFADISGFTNLSETLSKRGSEGAELLAFALNRYMELLVKAIGRSGGDIFKFAGDAMIVLWPPPLNDSDEELNILLRQAIQSALDIQLKLHDTSLIENIKLRVKIGFGVGEVTILHVGGVFNRAEYLAAGDPLKQAFESEHLAEGKGEVIVSNQVWERISDFFEGSQIHEHDHNPSPNGPFFLITNLKANVEAVQMKADALLIRTHINNEQIDMVKRKILRYIPAAVVPFIKLDQERWAGELRRLTIMFLNVGIDLSDAKTDKGLERIQKVIETIQMCVYQYIGSLNKLLMDDKGSTLVVVFGFPPLSHQDDAVRACLCAVNLCSEMKKINTTVSIGIATGTVFAGVVGSSGSRREYSVLGDSVNLAARIMQISSKEKTAKVLVDDETKKDASHKISFRFFQRREVKGKSGLFPFFEPVINDENPSPFPTNPSNLFPEMKIHVSHVPSSDEEITVDQKMIRKYTKIMQGRSESQELLKNRLKKFLDNPTKSMIQFIHGPFGGGKTLLARDLMDNTYLELEQQNVRWKHGEKTHMIACTVPPIHAFYKFNLWWPIIRKILNHMSERLRMSREDVLGNIFRNHPLHSKLNLIEPYLDLRISEPGKRKEIPFLMKGEESAKDEKKAICRILVRIFMEYLEYVPNPDGEDEANQSVDEEEELEKITNRKAVPPPLILCVDDMQAMDGTSWALLFKVLNKIRSRIFFIGIARQDPYDRWEKHLDMDEGISMIMSIGVNKMELTLEGLGQEVIHQLILSFFGITKMAASISTLIKDKTDGNPLDSLHFMSSLISSGFIIKDGDELRCSEKLEKAMLIEEFIHIPAPLSRIKVNGTFVDKIECERILLMKIASVIGNSFDAMTLLRINPFKDRSIQTERAIKILKDLENMDFIEVLDEQKANKIYRFTNPFLREVIYQRIAFSQRRQLHKYVAEAIQAMPQKSEDDQVELERLMFHWVLADNSEDGMPNRYSTKAKRSLIVKKISNILAKKDVNASNAILRAGYLEKKSSEEQRWYPRWVILTVKELLFFHSEEEYRSQPDEALATICLKHVYNLSSANESEVAKKHAFVLNTGIWQKRSSERGVREFFLSTENEDKLEEWLTYIEFARAKAIYDEFVSTFGKISFPLNDPNVKKDNYLQMMFQAAQEQTAPSLDDKNTQRDESKMMSSFRRGTKARASAVSQKLKLNELEMSYQETLNMHNRKKTQKERLHAFFSVSQVLFWSHIFEISALSQEEYGLLGRTTKLVRRSPHVIRFNQDLNDEVLSPEERPKSAKQSTSSTIEPKKVSIDSVIKSDKSNDLASDEAPKQQQIETSDLSNQGKRDKKQFQIKFEDVEGTRKSGEKEATKAESDEEEDPFQSALAKKVLQAEKRLSKGNIGIGGSLLPVPKISLSDISQDSIRGILEPPQFPEAVKIAQERVSNGSILEHEKVDVTPKMAEIRREMEKGEEEVQILKKDLHKKVVVEDRRMTFAPDNFQLEEKAEKFRPPAAEKNERIDGLVLGSINNHLDSSGVHKPSKIKVSPQREKDVIVLVEPQENATLSTLARDEHRHVQDRFEPIATTLEQNRNQSLFLEPEQRPFEKAVIQQDDITRRVLSYEDRSGFVKSTPQRDYTPTRYGRDPLIQPVYNSVERITQITSGQPPLASFTDAPFRDPNSSYMSEKITTSAGREISSRIRTPSKERSPIGESQGDRKYGFAIKDCLSIDGSTLLKKGEFVTITKVLDRDRVFECKWEANKALFPSEAIYSIQSASDSKMIPTDPPAYTPYSEQGRKSPLEPTSIGTIRRVERTTSPIPIQRQYRDFKEPEEEVPYYYQSPQTKLTSHNPDGQRFGSQPPLAKERDNSKSRVVYEKFSGNFKNTSFE